MAALTIGRHEIIYPIWANICKNKTNAPLIGLLWPIVMGEQFFNGALCAHYANILAPIKAADFRALTLSLVGAAENRGSCRLSRQIYRRLVVAQFALESVESLKFKIGAEAKPFARKKKTSQID